MKGQLRMLPPGLIGRTEIQARKCDDCGSTFTSHRSAPFTINGVINNDGLCPWCREDSKPWTNGRGL